jgi:hypothetical protein
MKRNSDSGTGVSPVRSKAIPPDQNRTGGTPVPLWRYKRTALKYLITLLALTAAVPLTRAEYRDWLEQEDTAGWYAVPRIQYLRMDVEAEQDNQRSSGAPNLNTSRLYISPRIGIVWNNYLYHPYLLTYSALFEPGYVWQDRASNGKGTVSDQLILNGTFRANVLEVKPYATTLSYSRSHDEAKYGFFSTATVDSTSWGATSGYREGPVPVDVSFVQAHEDSSDFNQHTLTDQSLFNLRAHNDRANENATALDYQYSKFDRTTRGPGYDFSSDSIYNHASLTDVEHFERSDLKTAARVNAVESKNSSSTDLNAMVNYNVTHTPDLHSFYDYSFSRFGGNNSVSIQNYAVAGLQHQLFESLNSSLEVHGSQLSSSAAGSTFDSQSAGTTASANYTKRLSDWGHLYLGNSSSYNFTDQQVSGSQSQIDNESHVVPTNSIVRLTQPRDTALISVTDASSNPLQASDYTLIRSTDPWQIQINSLGPSHILPGQTILVTYTIQSNPSGNYSTFANQSQIRVTFLGDHVGVFAVYNFTDSRTSSKDLLLENEELFEVGADFNWRGLGLTANYTDDRSTFYNNRSYNLAESYSMTVSSHSTFGVDLNQQWNINSSKSIGGAPATPEQHMTFYNFMLHYEWRPFRSLNWNTEIGYQRQQGFGLDQDLFAARTYVNWMYGKLQIHLGYQHENQDLPREKRDRDFAFLSLRRDF